MAKDDFAVRLVAGLLEARTGQKLSKDRHWRIETALSGLLREYRLDSVEQLVNRLLLPNQNDLTQAVVEALLNNETYFFRDRAQFDVLSGSVLADLAKRRASVRKLSIWSAGCSTGQEAYSLAMMFIEQRSRWAGWSIEIVATDVSRSAIKAAREACYTPFHVQRGLAVGQMLNHFRETDKGWVASPEVRRLVRFQNQSIFDAAPTPGQFDLVLCRNVLLYFDADARTRALDRIAQAMTGDGYLMLGGGETASGHSDRLIPCAEIAGFFRPGTPNKSAMRAPRRAVG